MLYMILILSGTIAMADVLALCEVAGGQENPRSQSVTKIGVTAGRTQQARSRQSKSAKTKTPRGDSIPMGGIQLIGAVCGMSLGGPIGMLAGAKLGGLAAVGGSMMGYSGARAAQDQRGHKHRMSRQYRPAHLHRAEGVAGYRTGPAGLKTPVGTQKHAARGEKAAATQNTGYGGRREGERDKYGSGICITRTPLK